MCVCVCVEQASAIYIAACYLLVFVLVVGHVESCLLLCVLCVSLLFES